MRKIFHILLFTFFCLQVLPANPEIRKIQSGGFEREYLIYIPEKYNASNPSGLIVCLHGFNRTMNDFFENYNITGIAESLNMIVIAPQALPEKSNDVLNKFDDVKKLGINMPLSLDAVWGCGLQVKATLVGLKVLDVVLNEGIDDVSFINQLITETEQNYNIITENKFIFGTSMGGYMSYQYALYNGNRLSGLINICGSMGTAIKNTNATVKLPVCDFHSVDDEVVPYNGSSNIAPLINVSFCQKKGDVINFWVNKNSANPIPTVENLNYYPSTTGFSATKYTYSGEKDVIHYKITGASHSYFFKKETDCMDHVEEVAKFITAHSKDIDSGNDAFTQHKQLEIYPNPVVGPLINLNVEKGLATIYNFNGQKVFYGTFENGIINIGTLQRGIYFIRVMTEKECYQGKLIVR